GREEIADAVRKLVKQRLERGAPPAELLESITPEEIARHLYMADSPDPDLIIRTSGEVRLSGFLLWQSAYSEFYFCDVHWPEFRKIDFLRALRSYQQRARRFGAGDRRRRAVPSILILSAPYGAGHSRAAEAVAQA